MKLVITLFIVSMIALVVLARGVVIPAIEHVANQANCVINADKLGIEIGACNSDQVIREANIELNRRQAEQAAEALKTLKRER